MGFSMRPSRVLRKLRDGEIAYCFKLNLPDIRTAQIASSFGFDCIWNCMEHVPNDLAEIEAQVLACKAYNVDVMCRVKRGSYSDHILPLELDATGIMVPHIMSLEDAKNVIRMCRFHPVGRRPLDGGNTDGAYCNVSLTDYLEQANRERFIVLQIEDPEPMAELDEIAQVEGIDIILFGPGDFSHALGCVGQLDDPRVVEAERRVVQTAVRHGKFAGAVAGIDMLPTKVQWGFRFINVGADVLALTDYFGRIAKAFQAAGA